MVYVNEAFRPQRISGQQRYATEISDRLPLDVQRVRPGPFWSASALRTWLWVQTVLPLRTWRGVLISLTARAPLWHPRHLLVIHDLFVIEHPEWFSKKFALTHAPLLRFQLRTAKAFAAVSEPVAEQVRARRPGVPVVVAPNAPSDVFKQPSDDQSVLEEYGLTAGTYLMVVGNLDPRKNLPTLAEAYGALDADERAAMPLVVVGGSADIYRQSPIDWPTGTVVTGYVSDEDLRNLYRYSLAVVFPSLAEGFGLPIVEAAAAGAPKLLVSDIPVFRWVCREKAGYVEPDSVRAWTTALDRQRISNLPEACPSLAAKFSWPCSATRMIRAADVAAGGLDRVWSEFS